jgi:hypothetical protein
MQSDIQTRPRDRDRGRGLPSLGYQLRHLEKRVRQLEAALGSTTASERRTRAEPTTQALIAREDGTALVAPAHALKEIGPPRSIGRPPISSMMSSRGTVKRLSVSLSRPSVSAFVRGGDHRRGVVNRPRR